MVRPARLGQRQFRRNGGEQISIRHAKLGMRSRDHAGGTGEALLLKIEPLLVRQASVRREGCDFVEARLVCVVADHSRHVGEVPACGSGCVVGEDGQVVDGGLPEGLEKRFGGGERHAGRCVHDGCGVDLAHARCCRTGCAVAAADD